MKLGKYILTTNQNLIDTNDDYIQETLLHNGYWFHRVVEQGEEIKPEEEYFCDDDITRRHFYIKETNDDIFQLVQKDWLGLVNTGVIITMGDMEYIQDYKGELEEQFSGYKIDDFQALYIPMRFNTETELPRSYNLVWRKE